jgi:hypothetical protein
MRNPGCGPWGSTAVAGKDVNHVIDVIDDLRF